MKILITGANGQLGRELTKRLQGTDFLPTDVAEMDITDQNATRKVIESYRPGVVIHGAAYTNVDGAEANPDLAYKINAVGTQNVAVACLNCGAKMVYISTDYVFDGTLGRAYNDFDQPNPQSVYGKSKYAGETLAKHILNRLFIVRTSWLYGDGNNFVRTMLKLGQERDEIKVVNDQHGCPTSTKDLAEVILKLIDTESYGTYHAANTGVTTWYDFARKIFELSGNTRVKVLPQTTEELNRPAPRPMYSPFENRMLRLAIGHTVRPWEEALKEYILEFRK
ncbi:rmld: dtdp-4-dehydrorhamnose reductase [Lucifera butyrica]|uniref:dTDP-4-dehydrorhamnose reductase n=1 Tax=Lucifera butyrica TaxID=1351585 RepID=A0A498REG3_9FIRM|nr:dTDP-4-dehydrorhamnose reductase [Lucifera butyrica]VBB09327.1 rmld: dtdp-4-dehydrorhamnose reductase [Lucifera butyrica]